MWKSCLFVSALMVTVMGGQADYTITPSSQVAYYHYPAPPKSQQVLHEPPLQTANRQYAPSSAQSYQNQQSYYQQQQQQQQQPQSRYFSQSIAKSQYPSNSNNFYRSPVVTKQFTSAALDNAAFTMALTNQGYTTTRNNAPSALRPQASASSAPAQLALQSSSATGASSNSLNVKLPLPFNTTPLNIAPLPLQAGTPYSAIPNGVTSYGTTYPQRKRR